MKLAGIRGALVATFVALAGAPARADSATAARLDAEAEQLAARRDFLGAALKFRDAYAADPRPERMCNVGVAYFKASDWPRAHRYLQECVDAGATLPADFVASARKVLDAILQKLASGNFTPVDFAVSPPSATIAIAGSPFDEPLVGRRRLYLPHGLYRATLHAEGYTDRVVDVDARGREAVGIFVTLERTTPTAPAPVPAPAAPPPAAPAPRAERPAPPIEPGRAGPSRTPALVATGATVALAAAAVVFYVRARGAVDDAESAVHYPEFVEHRDAAKRDQRIAWALGGVAGATAVVSGYLWYRATRSATTTVEVRADGQAAALAFGARF